MDGILVSLIIGALAGWLAGKILKGGGQGLLMNIVVGIIGGVIGNWLFGLLGISVGPGFTGAVISATVGAILLLYFVGKLKKN